MLVHELPVYVDTFQLVKAIYELGPKYPQAYRYTLGEPLCKAAIELFVPIQLANRAEDSKERIKYLERFFLSYETVKIRLKLSYELKCFSSKQYAILVELMENIGKQVNGWLKSSKVKSQVSARIISATAMVREQS